MKLTGKLLIGIVVVAIVAGGGWYFYSQGSQEFVIKPGEKLSDEQVSRLISRVAKFLVLPDDEQPSVAAISDAAALAERQAFYRDAKDGDILLVFSTKAIIYDAVNDKLVNVGPIVRTDDISPTGSGSAGTSPSPTPDEAVEPEAVDIEVRNGTSTAGLAGAMASDLKDNELFNVEKVGDASESYTKTVIVDLSEGDGKAAAVEALADEINAEIVTELPDGERETTSEVLILIGK